MKKFFATLTAIVFAAAHQAIAAEASRLPSYRISTKIAIVLVLLTLIAVLAIGLAAYK
jgi:hypothetical protein